MSEALNDIELVRCIYASSETENFDEEKIMSLLKKARLNNSKINVTGMLLYDEGSFFQVLEGDRKVVENLYDTISNDKRHRRITKIVQEPIEERDFSEWTMGHSRVTREDLKNIDGLNDFFYTRNCFTELDEGRAKRLLEAFKDGQWRATLN